MIILKLFVRYLLSYQLDCHVTELLENNNFILIFHSGCFQQGKDFNGADLKNQKEIKVNFEYCWLKCMEQDECNSFTFEAKTGSCWSKNQIDGDLKENKKGLISANKECFIVCPANQYKVGSECTKCPIHSVSLEGSTSPSNCTSFSKLHLVNL